MTENEPTNPIESLDVLSGDEGSGKFKRCDEISFYRRQRRENRQQYRILLDTLVLTEKGAVMEIQERNSQVQLFLQVCALRSGTVRVTLDELKPLRARYKVPDVLAREPVYERLRLEKKETNGVTLGWGVCQYQVRIQACPLLLEVLCEGEVTVTLNQWARLFFEVLQDPPKKRPLASVYDQEDPTGLWKEKFKHFEDIKANGPTSVGLDIRLHGFSHLYGIPEHADTFQLKDTSDGEPYRLYNLDVFAYGIHSRMGLYGSVPLLLAHSTSRTIGVFWLNASETLLDLQCSLGGTLPFADEGASLHQVKRRKVQPHTDQIWMSESGVIDAFILLGPRPPQVFSQYAELTGYQALPPLFSLGYHQCRWNYENEADVKGVDAGFDSHSIPYDVIWLDIEHTDQKRYFTWDPKRFPDPVRLQRLLEEKNRKLVVISDPHIKVDPAWHLYCKARDSGYFVRDRDGSPFLGSCWPGNSCYLDFSSSKVRAWYSSLFTLEKYKDSTEILFVWNDMNEPSVFNGPEMTMPKDVVHHGNVEHRELHNLYGFYQHLATVEGLISRSRGLERPFVLSRSFFAGSQRLGAVWTGDNVATWEHLKISIPMLLSLSVAGIAFCGADVGGFFRDPEPELLVRWYQAGSLQPFFRGHSCREMKRREPWLFGDHITAVIRSAVHQRYCLLPYWYTLFYQAHTTAQPPMRPLWAEFPGEQDTFSVENQYMIGSALLACPVTDPGVTEVKVLLPGFGEFWYDIQTNQVFAGGKTVSLPVTLDTVPLFQRGGTIVPRKTGPGSCTADLQKLPFSLTVALDFKGCANGELFLDDGHSFSYEDRKQFSLCKFSLSEGRLLYCRADEAGYFDQGCTVSTVVVLGVKKKPSHVTTRISDVEDVCSSVQYQEDQHLLLVGDLNLYLGKDWEIKIQ